MNPRYLAYCRAHGFSDPNAMLTYDEDRWPGGKMCGFMLWIQDQWRMWKNDIRRHNLDILSEQDHKDFDVWLKLRNA